MRKKKVDLVSQFKGKLVTVTTDVMTTITQVDEETQVSQSMPVAFEAYVISMDDDYFYLGVDTPFQVTDVVQRTAVKHIGLIQNISVLDKILDESVPEGEMN